MEDVKCKISTQQETLQQMWTKLRVRIVLYGEIHKPAAASPNTNLNYVETTNECLQ